MGHRKRFVIAGEGGQGVQVVGEILAAAAYRSGLESLYIPNFGVEQRGGASIAFVQISDEPIGAPKFEHADIMAVLSRRAFERTRGHQGPDTVVIYDSSDLRTPVIDDKTVGIQGWETIAPEGFAASVGRESESVQDKSESESAHGESGPEPRSKQRFRGILLPIPASDVAKDELTPRVLNMIVLGAMISLSESINEESVMEALEAKLGAKFAKDESLRELNRNAIKRGTELVQQVLSQAGVSHP